MSVLQLCGPRDSVSCNGVTNAGPGKEDKLLHLDDHLIWCSKVDSGPRISLPFLVDLPL